MSELLRRLHKNARKMGNGKSDTGLLTRCLTRADAPRDEAFVSRLQLAHFRDPFLLDGVRLLRRIGADVFHEGADSFESPRAPVSDPRFALQSHQYYDMMWSLLHSVMVLLNTFGLLTSHLFKPQYVHFMHKCVAWHEHLMLHEEPVPYG